MFSQNRSQEERMNQRLAIGRGGEKTRWLLLLLLFLSGCSGLRTEESPESLQLPDQGREFVVWVLSDIQPETPAERELFEQAVADVNDHISQVDMGIIAGDLMRSHSRDEDFAWFLNTRKSSKVRAWYEIAGNHDVRSDPLFHRYFHRPAFYSVTFGNILWLLLSDELPSSETEISDEGFAWWRDMVLGNQDRIIITVSHAQLQHSGLLGSFVASRRIARSKRFERVLKQARVAVWASGHTHLPQGLSGTVSFQDVLGGTCFVNVSAINTSLFANSQSRFFYFREGSDRLLIRSRNHSQGRFDAALDVIVPLDKPFVFSDQQPSSSSAPQVDAQLQ